jgi:hypothetical protein
MNTLDILLLNGLCYVSGILTGLGLCFKYKKHLLLKTNSHEQLSELMNTLTQEMPTSRGPPDSQTVMASAPPMDTLKEVIIRSQ